MKNDETIPEQDPRQSQKRSKRNSPSRQPSLFLMGGFGKKDSNERFLDLFKDVEQDRNQHPYGAGAR